MNITQRLEVAAQDPRKSPECQQLLRDAAVEIKRLGKVTLAAIQVIDGDVRGLNRKVDKCAHGRYSWEDCEQCITDYLQAAIAQQDKKE